ncbi:MAG TPA: response regulator transcription factor [Terriglobia bacterium]|nr:response regulator transcription factor [Terriglobia bacterium]
MNAREKPSEVRPPGTGSSAPLPGMDVRRRMLRIWMVDDDADLRDGFAQMFNREPGLRVTEQFGSIERLLNALAEQRPPDLILLDLSLRHETGLTAITPIKRLAPTVKILMFTTFNDTNCEAEAFRLGASGFLLKIYDVKEIVALIREAYYNPAEPRLFPNLPRNADGIVLPPVVSPQKKRRTLTSSLRQLFRRRGRQATQ